MSLESLNTSASLITIVIVAATAIAALVQLRHMRQGNQINAMLSIGDKFQGPEFAQASELVAAKIELAMQDASFRDYLISFRNARVVPEVDATYVMLRRAALLLGNTFEELGILVRKKIIDREIFLDRYCNVIIRAWERLAAFLGFIRAVADDQAIWENFELITVLSQDYSERYQSTYPKGMRHLPLVNAWPVTQDGSSGG
jgi:hypothetical protein